MVRKWPKYVSGYRNRHGKLRTRFRRTGFKTYNFKAKPGSDDWALEYQACKSGKAAPPVRPGEDRLSPGSLEFVMAKYYGSPDFKSLKPITKRTYRATIETLRASYGQLSMAALKRNHIKRIMQKLANTPSQANKTLKMFRLLTQVALDLELIENDPTIGIKPLRTSSEGYHTWTEEELQQFMDHHPIGTKQRLAFELLLYTAQRRSDVVRMGWQHIKNGKIRIKQQKTGQELLLPLHPNLANTLEAMPKTNMTFLTTQYGKPISGNGFGNWFRKACDKAGLPHFSAHGLRKAAARRLAEAGATDRQIMAVTGHKSSSEVTRYTKKANQAEIAETAMRLSLNAEIEQNLANPSKKVSQNHKQNIDKKG